MALPKPPNSSPNRPIKQLLHELFRSRKIVSKWRSKKPPKPPHRAYRVWPAEHNHPLLSLLLRILRTPCFILLYSSSSSASAGRPYPSKDKNVNGVLTVDPLSSITDSCCKWRFICEDMFYSNVSAP
jgi:hypothetical protein